MIAFAQVIYTLLILMTGRCMTRSYRRTSQSRCSTGWWSWTSPPSAILRRSTHSFLTDTNTWRGHNFVKGLVVALLMFPAKRSLMKLPPILGLSRMIPRGQRTCMCQSSPCLQMRKSSKGSGLEGGPVAKSVPGSPQ